MSNNYMVTIANILGVTIGDSFEVDCCTHSFTLTMDGLLDCEGKIDNQTLVSLLTGKANVVQKPWKPKYGDTYYYIVISDDYTYIDKTYWFGESSDCEMYHMGNYFKTEQEARDNIKAYKEFMMSVKPCVQWRNGNE